MTADGDLRLAAKDVLAELRDPHEVSTDEAGWVLVRRSAINRLHSALGVLELVDGENPDYGPGNPDWGRDFERTRE